MLQWSSSCIRCLSAVCIKKWKVKQLNGAKKQAFELIHLYALIWDFLGFSYNFCKYSSYSEHALPQGGMIWAWLTIHLHFLNLTVIAHGLYSHDSAILGKEPCNSTGSEQFSINIKFVS